METGMSGNGQHAAIHFSRPPTRVVSLVPSVTESLFDLGLGNRLVGVTDYCIHPASGVAGLARIGGPKNPNVDRIVALKPDMVIANREENLEPDVIALEAAGLKVWVTFPQTAREAMDILWVLVRVFDVPREAIKLRALEQCLQWTVQAARSAPRVRVFCPVWRDTRNHPPAWWMTINRQTYAHDVLENCGGENVFAERERRYPLAAELGGTDPPADAPNPVEGRDTRYPRVTPDEIRQAAPEVILLPSEPYAFDESDEALVLDAFAGTPAVRAGHVHRVDGSLITWHGTRLAKALAELPSLLSQRGDRP